MPDATDGHWMVATCDEGCATVVHLPAGDRLASHATCIAHGRMIFYRSATQAERGEAERDHGTDDASVPGL